MDDDSRSCPSCGARVPSGADRCDLCGAAVGSPPEGDPGIEDPDGAVDEHKPPPAGPSQEQTDEAVFCNHCGHRNPEGANYCSQCGSELEDLSASATDGGTRAVRADLPTGSRRSGEERAEREGGTASFDGPRGRGDEQAAMGKQILWMVGIGMMLVLGFFFATQWSQQYDWGGQGADSTQATAEGGERGARAAGARSTSESAASPSDVQPNSDLQSLVDKLSGSVEGPIAGTIDSLRSELEGAQGAQKRQLRAELVKIYIGAGAPGRAALVQRTIADNTGAPDDRRHAADLLYRWMRQVQKQGDRARIADVARHVASAYAAVAEERPQDLDARTRMGEAYLLTNNPMKGIQAINAVLEDDSTFVPARFQKGLALLQINRLDQALRQFEKVKTFADSDEPFYKQAQRAIDIINKQRASAKNEKRSTQQ